MVVTETTKVVVATTIGRTAVAGTTAVTMIVEGSTTAVVTKAAGVVMTTEVVVDMVTMATGEVTRVAQEDPHQSKCRWNERLF